MKDKQKTIILVEHKIDLIAEYADDVACPERWRIDRSGG